MSDAQDHKEKMQKVQAQHRKKVSEAVDPGRGLVLINIPTNIYPIGST